MFHKLSESVVALLIISVGLGTISVLDVGSLSIRVWQLCVAVYFCLVIVWLSRKPEPTVSISLVLLLLSGYFMAVVLSGFNAIDIALWLKRVLLNAMYFLLFILIYFRARLISPNTVTRTIIFSGTFFAILSMLDLYFFKYIPDLFHLLHSLEDSSDASGSYLAGYGDLMRARGFAEEANEFSQYLVIPFGYTFAALLIGNNSARQRYFLAFSLASILVAQLSSLSRGGLFAFLSQILCFLILARSKRVRTRSLKRFLFSLVPILCVVFFALLSYQAYFEGGLFNVVWTRLYTTGTSDDWTTSLRVGTMLSGLEVATSSLANFLIGIGAGNLDVSSVSEATTTNIFIDIFVETGLLGALSFVSLSVTLLMKSIYSVSGGIGSIDGGQAVAMMGSALAFFGLLAGGLTYPTHVLLYFWVSAALLEMNCKNASRLR